MFCVVDTETTGLDSERHALVQVAFGLKKDLKQKHFDEVQEFKMTYGSYEVDPKALEVNKLTLEQLDKWPERLPTILRIQGWLDSVVEAYGKLNPVGHHYPFDEKFLLQICGRSGYSSHFTRHALDTKVIAFFMNIRSKMFGDEVSYSLDGLRDFYGITRNGNHEATKDITDTAEVLRLMLIESN